MRGFLLPILFICICVANAQPPVPVSLLVPAFSKKECILKKGKLLLPGKYLNSLSFQENLAPVQLTDSLDSVVVNKTGFVNTSGEFVIPAIYDLVVKPFRHGQATVGTMLANHIRVGIIDKKNKTVVPIGFAHIGEIRNNIALVQDTLGWWGAYNILQKITITPKYDQVFFLRKSYLLVNEHGKRGLLNTNGEKLISADYKQISFLRDGVFETKEYNTFYIRDTLNQIVDSLACDSIISLYPNIYKYALNGKYRIKKGNEEQYKLYDSIGSFYKHKAIVKDRGKVGLIDTSGLEIMKPLYSEIKLDTNGYIYLCKSTENNGNVGKRLQAKWGVSNSQGNIIVPIVYNAMGQFSEHLLAVCNEMGLWGYVDTNNLETIPFKFMTASKFSNGFAAVSVQRPYKKIYFYINQKGDTAITPRYYNLYAAGIVQKDTLGNANYDSTYNEFHKFSALSDQLFKVKYGYKYGVGNKNGALVVSIDYDSITYSAGGNCVIVYKDGQPGIFSATGDTLHPVTDKYEKIFPFYEGYARVMKGNKFGCIDLHKNRRISIQYDELHDFTEGIAGATLISKWGFIDKNEQLAVQPYYDEVKPFRRGIARVRTGKYWDFVDKEGKRINSSLYEAIDTSASANWIITYNGKVGLADSSGRQMLVPRYHQVADLGNGYIQVWKDGKTGLLNYDQDFVIPIEFDQLTYDQINQSFVHSKKGKIKNVNIAILSLKK